jgi:hypothetical protein
MWAVHDVAAPGTRIKLFQLVDGDRLLRTTSTALSIASAPECRLIVYTPIDEDDRAALARVLASPGRRGCPVHWPT